VATLTLAVARARSLSVLTTLVAPTTTVCALVLTVAAALAGDASTAFVGVALAGLGAALTWVALRPMVPARPAEPELALAGTDALGFASAGMVTSDAARIWFRSPQRDAPHHVSLLNQGGELLARATVTPRAVADGTAVVRAPDDFDPAAPLEPDTTYFARVAAADGRFSAEARFRTAPRRDATTEPFSLLVLSCHQPFDADGRVRAGAMDLLRALPEACEARGVRRVLLLGDQVYADEPIRLSLFDDDYFTRVGPEGADDIFACTREQVRALWHQRHRMYWTPPAMQRLQAGWATHMILDDHELIDNFGSAEAHHRAPWTTVREGALDAVYDYQSARCLPPDGDARPRRFSHALRHGPVILYVADLRCDRRVDGDTATIMSDAQFAELEETLREHGDAPIAIIALSVPILHLPAWLVELGVTYTGEGSNIDDRWSAPNARAQRARLLTILHDWIAAQSGRRVVMVGGDVHVGAVTTLRWPDGITMHTLISSAMSNLQPPALREVAGSLPAAPIRVEVGEHELRGELLGGDGMPFTGLNAGFVHVRPNDAGALDVELELIGISDDAPGRPRTRIRVPVPS
ncbi:MAG: alkaline phosphatase D family protein, partial [Myxococcales bacterium]|nr:alkaline phosphatase D family protein [Myxococcales bacterium]